MENEERNMSMTLVKFTDGPLAGQEREVQGADTLGAEYPGYSPMEQVLDPASGQHLTVQWTGEAAYEAAYGDSEQERERYGNQTGLRGREAVDKARGHHQMTSGAQDREEKKETKSQVKDRREAK